MLPFLGSPPLCLCPCAVTSVASSAECVVTFVAATPVVTAVPFVPLVGVHSMEPSRKRHREDSASSSEKMEMLADFEKVWAAHKSSSRCSPMVIPWPSFASMASSTPAL